MTVAMGVRCMRAALFAAGVSASTGEQPDRDARDAEGTDTRPIPLQEPLQSGSDSPIVRSVYRCE